MVYLAAIKAIKKTKPDKTNSQTKNTLVVCRPPNFHL